MSALRTAAQQALEALEDMLGWQSLAPQTIQESAKGRAAALKAALAKPVQDHFPDITKMVQEPVAWRFQSALGGWAYGSQPPLGSKYPAYPLYTAPPRLPLTEEEIHSLFRTAGSPTAFARAIERAHGIKEAALAKPVQEPPCATRECMPSECPNCASLEAQNTELDRKLAELEAALRAQS